MFRRANVGGLAISLLLLLISCQDNQPTSPDTSPILTVHITGLDSAIFARDGQVCTSEFQVLVTDDQGEPVPDAPVALWVDSGPGDVSPAEGLSGPSGIVDAVYYVTVSGCPHSIIIMSVNDDGEDAGGGTWFVEVSAFVGDINDNPIADRTPVIFSVEPEIASIEPGYTGNVDQSGRSMPGSSATMM